MNFRNPVYQSDTLFPILWILLLSLWSSAVFARETTQPPSVALRKEASFVSVAHLQTKQPGENNTTTLKFTLIKDLHNQSEHEININVGAELAETLGVNIEYVIAYQKHHKVRVKELKQYQPIPGGPTLLNVQGANPAIFRRHTLLEKQLSTSPALVKQDPQSLINNIFEGTLAEDPKVKDFFVREIVNWTALHKHLDTKHYDQLYEILISLDSLPSTLAALIESRPNFNDAIGIQRTGVRALNILEGMPVTIDNYSETPNLALQAMLFVERHELSNWTVLSRWVRSNNPALCERALIILNKLDSKKALALAKRRINDTHLSQPTRRTINRFITKSQRNLSNQ